MDRDKALSEGQELTLNGNGVSRFGFVYLDSLVEKPFEVLNEAEQREHLLDRMRIDHFPEHISRLQACFGAKTIEDIKRFAEKIEPKPTGKIPVFEVFVSDFNTLDMRWLDYTPDHELRLQNFRNYWGGAITNYYHIDSGQPLPPLMEVLMALPVKVGKIVDWV
jgi:hypothetical protein